MAAQKATRSAVSTNPIWRCTGSISCSAVSRPASATDLPDLRVRGGRLRPCRPAFRDRQVEQDAGVAGQRIVVGQRRLRPRDPLDGAAVGAIAERDRRRSHQRAVAGAAAARQLVVRRPPPGGRPPGTRARASACADGRADVLGAVARPHQVAGEHVVLVVAAPLGQALRQRDRHRRVVRPLPQRPHPGRHHVAQRAAVASDDLLGMRPTPAPPPARRPRPGPASPRGRGRSPRRGRGGASPAARRTPVAGAPLLALRRARDRAVPQRGQGRPARR